MTVENDQILDVLFDQQNKITFQGKKYPGYEKHGSGCVFSSSVTTFLAKGHSIPQACKMAKRYVEYFLLSSKTRLGLHHLLNNN
jgi:hydroxymethylpyrimidine/phosphomethylpyrimidine kinase